MGCKSTIMNSLLTPDFAASWKYPHRYATSKSTAGRTVLAVLSATQEQIAILSLVSVHNALTAGVSPQARDSVRESLHARGWGEGGEDF